MKMTNINFKHKLKLSNNAQHQLGVTLIELMVAMAVSSVIMLGVSNIYLSTKKSYVVHDEFSRIQENGRYSVETLSSDIRNAGFFGCASGQGLGTVTNTLNNTKENGFNLETGVMGYEAVGTDINETLEITPTTPSGAPADWVTAAGLTSGGTALNTTLPTKITDIAIAGSDILVVRTSSGSGIKINRDNSSAALFVEDTGDSACPDDIAPATSGKSGICPGDILMVSDCSKSRIFQATKTQDGGGPGVCGTTDCFNLLHDGSRTDPGNALTAWNDQQGEDGYGPDSELIKIVTKTYFVGLDAASGQPSLFVLINDAAAPVQLIEGIENMQVLYGLDTNNNGVANQYFSADDVTDQDGESDTVFDGVVSTKVSLLIRTPNDMPGLSRTAADADGLVYSMISPAPASAITIDPVAAGDTTDRHMRKVYNFTVKIRNKSFNTSSLTP